MNHRWLLCGLAFMYNFSIAQNNRPSVETVASTDGRNHSINLHAKGLQSISIDDSDNIYACDVPDDLIVKIYPSGKIENISFHLHGNDSFRSINQITFKNGFLYAIAYATNSTIYKIAKNGEAIRLAGGISRHLFKDGTPDSAAFYNIRNMAVDDKGNMFLTANGIRIISNGFVKTLGKVKGQKPKYYGNDTLPPEIYYEPEEITVNDNDNIYVTTFMKGDILKVNLDDSASLYIKANKFYSSDTNSIDAKICGASSLVADKFDDLFVSDVSDGKIKLITPHKNIITIAGSGKHYKYPKDGMSYEASFSNPYQLVLDKSGNIYVLDDGSIRKIILPKNFIQNILSYDAAPLEQTKSSDKDSLVKSEIDNQSKNLDNIQPVNPQTFFQKLYSGKIGTEDAIFNLTLSPLNIRGQQDLTVWANIGNRLTCFYFSEDELFAKPKTWMEYSILDSFYIQHAERFSFEKRKYYTGWETTFLAPSQQKLLIRFTNNNARLEGFLIDNSGAKRPIHFILSVSKPSFPLSYKIAAFHKDTKYINDSTIKEVPANVSLAIDLPENHNLDYDYFLNAQAGYLIGVWENKENDDGFNKNNFHFADFDSASGLYKKEFYAAKKFSHINHSRSLIGGYDNTQIVYNQKDWLITQQDHFAGDVEGYGEHETTYLSYDVQRKTFLNRDDVLISSDSIQALINKDSVEYLRYDFAFVCADGVAFRLRGNHGWTYDSFLLNWKDVLPLLNESFKKEYAYLWNKQ